jgi:hypothetical protein
MQRADKVCVLDFDGVVQHEDVRMSRKHGIFMAAPGRVLFEWVDILEDLLLPHEDVKIVLSTSWVRVRSFNYARAQLTPALQDKVIGATFHRREMRRNEFDLMPRGVQVAQDILRRGPKAWFALDDDDFGWPAWCRDNLIKTDGAAGISDPAIQHAVRKMLLRL